MTVSRFVTAFSWEGHGERPPRLPVAVLFVLAGVPCPRCPLRTVAALSLVVGVVWLLSGMLTASAALAAKGLAHRGLVLGAAALGIVVLALPVQSAVVLIRLLGLVELGVAFARRSAPGRARGGALPGPAATG